MTTMNRVFVLDKNKKPLMPCRPARARRLLNRGRAAVYRFNPFTIILFDRTYETSKVQAITLKFDPGSKVTGIALVATFKRGETLIWAANLTHRGWMVKERLQKRRNVRRSRRNRKTRYRPARFKNRRRAKGWLPPSLISRIDNVYNWAQKLIKLSPVARIEVETARFDTQKVMNPEISGIEYQQGTLQGYEVREYLLEKWQRKCAYCDKEGIPLQIEHIHAKGAGRGGTNRVSNLTIACAECNVDKGTRDIRLFLAHDPERLDKILSQAKQPLKDAAVMNAIRYAIGDALKSFGIPVSFWTGGRTKMNRIKQGYPKDHWIDAVCVGESGANVNIRLERPLYIKATGRGNRQRQQMNKYGFPRGKPKMPHKRVQGFQTGDYVRVTKIRGDFQGTYLGRVTVRADKQFDIATHYQGKKKKLKASWRYYTLLQRDDGYEYSHVPPKKKKPS